MNSSKKLYKVIAVAAPLLLVTAFLMKDFFIELAGSFPKCTFKAITGYDCPACGNTRSVLYLLRGEIFSAVRCNIAPPLLLTLLILLYIEMIFDISGKRVRLLPRKLAFWMCVIAAVMIYYVVRNFVDFLAPIP